MKEILATVILGASLLPGVSASYNDATGDIGVGSLPHIDISSVVVNNDSSTLTFKINLAGDPVATDWGKYMISIDSTAGGDTAGNGWGRPISMPSGMDYFLGSWVDFGNGAEIRKWTGSAWTLQSATYNPNPDSLSISKDTSSVTLSFAYAGLGLSAGSTFLFDVYTSGGGGADSAIDAAANSGVTVTAWDQPYSTAQGLSYTLVPEPTSLGLLGLAGIIAILRRRS